jgi:hypothetical protein
MKSSDDLVMSVEAILKPCSKMRSDQWTWGKVCLAVAKTCFGAKEHFNERVQFNVRGKKYTEKALSTTAWNQAVLAAAKTVRSAETPDAHDYRKGLYDDPNKLRLASKRIAEALREELGKSGLLDKAGD